MKLKYVGLILLLIIVLGFGGSQLFSIAGGSGNFIGVPTYGYYSCEQSDLLVDTNYDFFKAKYISCANAGTLLQDCVVTLRSPSRSVIGSVANADILYTKCEVGEPCNINLGDDFGERIVLKSSTSLLGVLSPVFNDANINSLHTISLTKNEYLYVEYQERSNIFAGFNNVNGKASFKISFKPFFIKKYDVFSSSNGAVVTGSEDCVYSGGEVDANYIIEDIRGGGKLSQDLEVSDLSNLNGLRSVGSRVTFLSNFVGVIPQFQLFEDDSKYCYDKKIFVVEEIDTPSGTFKVADTGTNKELQSVECCNDGDVGPGFACRNFVKVAVSSVEDCGVLNPCPVVGYQSVVGKKMISQECVNSKCVTDSISVECSFNEDCGTGYCSIDYSNPRNNKCVSPELLNNCGNGLCEASLFENTNTCSKDCKAVAGVDYTLVWVVAGFVLIVLLMFVVKKARGKRK